MKRLSLILTLLLAATTSLLATDYDDQQVIDRLMSTGFFTEVKVHVPATRYPGQLPFAQSYELYYTQPLQHNVEGSEEFPLRALLVLNYNGQQLFDAPVNQVFMGGYNIEEFWDKTDGMAPLPTPMAEVASRYGGHALYPEHRYFSKSAPAEPWTRLEHFNAHEAAQDIDNLMTAMRQAFTGQWVMTGVSKGGVFTSIQSVLYPDNIDLFIPYAAPWCEGQADKRPFDYVGRHTYREPEGNPLTVRFDSLMMRFFSESAVRDIFIKLETLSNPQDVAQQSEQMANYYFIGGVENVLQHLSAYVLRVSMSNWFSIQPVCQLSPLELSFYVFNQHIDVQRWQTFKELLKIPSAQTRALTADDVALTPEALELLANVRKQRKAIVPDAITAEEYKVALEIPYYYQAARELGYANYIHLPQFYADTDEGRYYSELDRKTLEELHVITMNVAHPWTAQFTYSDDLLREVMSGLEAPQKPVIFLYGSDDFWTGAAVRDEYVNGTSVQKHILFGQNHNVSISAIADTPYDQITKADLWAQIDLALGFNPSAIDELAPAVPEAQTARKVMSNGQFMIIRHGQRYNAVGERF